MRVTAVTMLSFRAQYLYPKFGKMLGDTLIDNIDTVTVAIAPCQHCGEPCEPGQSIHRSDLDFCCEGCATVYELLSQGEMCDFYNMDSRPGISQKSRRAVDYAYLDEATVRDKLIEYSDGDTSKVTLYLPQVHCTACIWLLEQLHKLHPGVIDSKVNFLNRTVSVRYQDGQLSLRQLAELLATIGYAPEINLGQSDNALGQVADRTFYYQLGIAGFAFGNIMLLSFPEYLGLQPGLYGMAFGYLNILLALPVLLFSSRDYLRSAWYSLRARQINIDVPLSLGIVALFGRSLYDILSQSGAGFMDSFAGLIFFLLIGKWFQKKTYHTLSFERDYKSYFPIAATVVKDGEERSVALKDLAPGQLMRIRNGELIPADGQLVSGEARIDYSFVTGEAEPVRRAVGDKLYAGGRQQGGAISVLATRRVSQSYLTRLWNESTDGFETANRPTLRRFADRVSQRFTPAILVIAFASLFYWWSEGYTLALNAFTAVLIIACPCALALTVPFTYGNVLRLLGRRRFFLKHTDTIEAMQRVSHIVFDKTGTLTPAEGREVLFEGAPLNETEMRAVKSMVSQSSHPLSRLIDGVLLTTPSLAAIKGFEEIAGQGIRGSIDGHSLCLGSAAFAGYAGELAAHTAVYLSIDGAVRGRFVFPAMLREGLAGILGQLGEAHQLSLLSGDNDRDAAQFAPLFSGTDSMHFDQKPMDKLQFVRGLQEQGAVVMMLGDGLNDAGALQQSEAGIVITEQLNNFTPACDAILDAAQLPQLPAFLLFVKRSQYLVYIAYGMALLYNVVGLSFAVQGMLSPLVAAILMPLSSVTIAIWGTVSSSLLALTLPSMQHKD